MKRREGKGSSSAQNNEDEIAESRRIRSGSLERVYKQITEPPEWSDQGSGEEEFLRQR